MVTWGPNTVFRFPSPGGTSAQNAFNTTTSNNQITQPTTTGFLFNNNSSTTNTNNNAATIGSAFSNYGTVGAVTGTGMNMFSPTNTNMNNATSMNNMTNMAPQQAAIQAHLNATMHQETTRLESELRYLQSAYSPCLSLPSSAPATSSLFSSPTTTNATNSNSTQVNPDCAFQHIFYDPLTHEQRYLNSAYSTTTGYLPPKTHPHISDEQWMTAIASNPNPDESTPILLTGPQALHSRLMQQQSQMNLHSQAVDSISTTLQHIEKNSSLYHQKLLAFTLKNKVIQHKILAIMKKLEIVRGKNVVFQPMEFQALQQMYTFKKQLMALNQLLEQTKGLADQYVQDLEHVCQYQQRLGMTVSIGANSSSSSSSSDPSNSVLLDSEYKEQVCCALDEHDAALKMLQQVHGKDCRDLDIIKSNIQPL